MAQSTSQVQHTAVFDGWRKLTEDQMTRLGSMFEETGKLEAAALEQAQAAVRELARLSQESLAYGARLASEWRRLALEAARGGAEIWKARG